jgi:ATP-dependent DNA helicase RecG
MAIPLQTSLFTLPRIGPKTVLALKRLNLLTVQDALWHFPFRYEDFRQLIPIADLKEGENVTVKAQLELIASRRSFRTKRTVIEGLVGDDTGKLRLVWFNQPFIAKSLVVGDVLFLSGKITHDHLGLTIVSPAYEKERAGVTRQTERLVPLYPLTSGITQKQLRSLIALLLPTLNKVPDWLPHEILTELDLLPLTTALHKIHFPASETELHQATERLKFDELLAIQLQAELSRQHRTVTKAPQIIFQQTAVKQLVESLPFALTPDQKKAAWEILQDIEKPSPMNRLLSGDVGSGKTVVAALPLFTATLNHFQSVLMVPTEILAAQHFESLNKLLTPHGVRVGIYTRTQKKLASTEELSKKKFLEAIKAGEVDVIIGTQALLSDGVDFKNLGLVIVDEQHRFGVEQRRIIKEKGQGAHFLSMTATPIPRSLALMIYGDLDVSLIQHLPPGRKQITTRLVEPSKREQAYDFIRAEVKKGRQVFVICPLIEPSEQAGKTTELEQAELWVPPPHSEDKKSVLSEYKRLSEVIFPDLNVGFLHGKLKGAEKDETMKRFATGAIDILVSTSVVEVGVNIPNASVMMIEGAERFGLAQLHQFRGRVGRAEHQSFCLLFTNSASKKALERLTYFESCHDGFKLAEKDLELRGPGEVYGTEQSGERELRLAKLTDTGIIKKARELAQKIGPHITNYPTIVEYMQNWQRTVHLE